MKVMYLWNFSHICWPKDRANDRPVSETHLHIISHTKNRTFFLLLIKNLKTLVQRIIARIQGNVTYFSDQGKRDNKCDLVDKDIFISPLISIEFVSLEKKSSNWHLSDDVIFLESKDTCGKKINCNVQ